MNILYFFIGTEAELMKMFKVIVLAKEQGFKCKIISNGQNMIDKSYFLPIVGGKIDIDLSQDADVSKSSLGYAQWFIKTAKRGIHIMKDEMRRHMEDNCLMVVHGDTLSTLMGAHIARKAKMKYVHVESGLRSYNWFSPFPEEIDRFLSSLHSEINFCPQDNYAEYASGRFKGKAISTKYNTGIETLLYALEENQRNNVESPMDEPYYILAIHRQENLLSKRFMEKTVEHALELSKKITCIFIYHVQTYNSLCKFGLWNKLKESPNVKIVERLPYCEFINYVYNSKFVIADGCGNQQEFYYLGKPYLVMRTKVEAVSEGLGWNAKCFEGDFSKIETFYSEYKNYIKPPITPEILPSKIIVNELTEYFAKI